ncbi:U1 small nuclear ribonucleoprotein of 70kDa MW N terminal-domain-containing protein [Kalaharituber pfeilii]|nr:U1 small nuclear ribonucleoprotein of 70kDa MW N terminal-domain-containing protein [Kalaharituber pfeilii]
MTDKLPANLLALFQPRPPLRYLPPCDYSPEQRRTPHVTGVAQFLQMAKDWDDHYVPTESIMQQRERLREEKKKKKEDALGDAIAKYLDRPQEDPQIRGDPYKTLFVSRLSYDVKESDLEREFGRFGPIERIRIVRSKDPTAKKPHRGYAFIVYEREKDMKGTDISHLPCPLTFTPTDPS